MLLEIKKRRDRHHQLSQPSSIAIRPGLNKTARSFLQGNASATDPSPSETDTRRCSNRACGKLLKFERVNVINDEAHHCYRHKVGGDAEGALTGRR